MRIGTIFKTMKATKSCGVMFFERWSLYVCRGKMKQISDSSVLIHRKEYKRFRRRLFRNHPHICECCGATDQHLEVHHVISVHDNPALALDEGNVRLLCHECHLAAHSKGAAKDRTYVRGGGHEIDYELALAFAGAF